MTEGLIKDLISGYRVLNGAKCFSEDDASQNHLVFQPVIKYFKLITNDIVMIWKAKGCMSDESIKPPTRAGNSLVS